VLEDTAGGSCERGRRATRLIGAFIAIWDTFGSATAGTTGRSAAVYSCRLGLGGLHCATSPTTALSASNRCTQYLMKKELWLCFAGVFAI
jgi:hypothetical protein